MATIIRLNKAVDLDVKFCQSEYVLTDLFLFSQVCETPKALPRGGAFEIYKDKLDLLYEIFDTGNFINWNLTKLDITVNW